MNKHNGMELKKMNKATVEEKKVILMVWICYTASSSVSSGFGYLHISDPEMTENNRFTALGLGGENAAKDRE